MNKTPTKPNKPMNVLSSVEKARQSSKFVENCIEIQVLSSEDDEDCPVLRRSERKRTPSKNYYDFITTIQDRTSPRKLDLKANKFTKENGKESCNSAIAPREDALELIPENIQIPGQVLFGFNTPKKKGAMAELVMNTPKTSRTPAATSSKSVKTPNTRRSQKVLLEPKTPSHIRSRMKNEISKLIEDNSGTDFSSDESTFEPSDEETSSNEEESQSSASENEGNTALKTPNKIIPVAVLPKTPASSRLREKKSRTKKTDDYIPEYEEYFRTHSSRKVHTSDHTLERLKNPRLPADRLFALLADMKISKEHETSIKSLVEEYKSYFGKWLLILNEGYNILVYGLGSKRELLQAFHREVLSQQPVLVVNGFFPSLTIKDVLDSVIKEILDIGNSPANAHEAVAMIEEEFSHIPETHLYLIVHNLDGPMLRNTKSQTVLARLANVSNIHLLASIDNIHTPLLWDHTKLCHYNFSWWDCTTMLPYAEETAYENSLLVQNSGELALSSMRSVFLSLTNNSRGIYVILVKYQLQHKSNNNYSGMTFKDLYGRCRESFLVSSDLALRAQLTEFLDHQLVKSKRGIDGSELLLIPIATELLQQFLDEQEQTGK